MRALFLVLPLILIAAPARAGGAEEFLFGRPPSVGVVQGGAFGADGSDYLGEVGRAPIGAPRPPRARARLSRAGHARPGAVVARPSVRP